MNIDALVRDLPQGRRFTLWFAAVLALGIGVSYSNSFSIGFNFDDAYGIVENTAIRSLRNMPSFFVDPRAVWTESTQVDLRPVVMCSYAVNYAISGLNTWSYHLFNLLIHFSAALLVFFIVRDHLWWPDTERGSSGEARVPAAAAALFFALAPLNTQPVDYLWARSALLCTAFYLGAFLALLNRRWKSGSALFALALLTKAIAVTLPATLLAYDFIYRDRKRHPTAAAYLADAKRLLLPVGLPALLCVCYVAYRHVFLPPWTAAARTDVGITPAIWFMSEWPALLYYARLFVWPTGLSADHAYPYVYSLWSPRACLSLFGLTVWIAAAVRGAKKQPLFAFATAWFFLTLMPESSFAPLAEVVNDHRPYIASLGLSALLVLLLKWGASRFGPRSGGVFAALSATLCLAAVPVTLHRNWEWQDPLRLWESAAYANPVNSRAWMNAGLAYMARGDSAQARLYFEKAVALTPEYVYIHVNLCTLDLAEGKFDAALLEAQAAAREQPGMAFTHVSLGDSLEKLGRFEPAAAAYRRALELDPPNARAQEGLARVRAAPGYTEEGALMAGGLRALYEENDPIRAQDLFRKVLERNPAHYGATFQLAVALDSSGQGPAARPYWEKVLAMAAGYHDQDTANRARLRLKTGP